MMLLALASVMASAQTCPTGVTHCNTLTISCTNGCAGTGDPGTSLNVYRATTCAALTPLPATVYATIPMAASQTWQDAPTSTPLAPGNSFCYAVAPVNTGGIGPAGITSLLVTPFQLPTVSPGVSGTAR